MPEKQRAPQGPAGVCDPSRSPGHKNQFNSNPGKLKIQELKVSWIHSIQGTENQGQNTVTKTEAPPGRAQAAPPKRGEGS